MDLIVANFTNSAVQKIGWSLIHFIWQATTVALLLAILLKILRNSSASLRYIVSCTALGLMILLPVVTIRLVPVSAPPEVVNIEPASAHVVLPAEPVISEMPVPMAETLEYEEIAQFERKETVSIVPWKQRAVDQLEPVLPYIVSVWLIGVFGLSVWHLGGWAQLQRLRKKMVRQVESSLQNKLKLLAERLGISRTVQLLESALVQVPTVIGWIRPVILLPTSALTGLSSEQLEAILAHELAHIKRFDYMINMLQTVVEILGFYHPAVWWISRRIRAERENCCDDLAVGISGDRICYASALTSMEEIRAGHGELAVAATGGNLFKRVYRLLGKDSGEKIAFSWVPSATVILLLAALLIPAGLALSTNRQTEFSAEFLLGKMLEHQSKIKNLQYVTEYDIWTSTKFTDSIEEHIREMKRERLRKIGIPEEQIPQMVRSTGQKPESRYEVLKCTIDNLERIKTERTTGTYDSSGNKSPDIKYISSWNGTEGTDFHQQKESPGSVTISDSKAIDALQKEHPWKTFVIRHNRELAEAIKNKRRINVEELKNGLLRMTLYYETSRVVAVIDPSQDYACTLWENYNDGRLSSRSTAKYEDVAKGIWFPVSGQGEFFGSDGSLDVKRTFKSSQIIVNDPAFDESYFSIDLPDGVHVTDLIRHKQYIVGSQNEYNLVGQEEEASGEDRESTEHIDPQSWQKAFDAVYCLEEKEVLKRIAPPFIPERRNYYLNQPRPPSSDGDYKMVSQYIFYWDGKLGLKSMSMGGLIRRLNYILRAVIGIGNFEYEIPDELLNIDMSGDWIVRKDTPKEILLKSLEQIIKAETGREIEFVKRQVQADVIIARGQYRFESLPGVKDGNYILLSTNKTDTYVGGGGGSGTVDELLRLIGSRINMKVIDETEPQDIKIQWRNHDSSDLGRMDHDDPRYDEQLDLFLKNLSVQTGLTFERTKTEVGKWFVNEHGNRLSQKTDMPAGTEIENIDSSAKVLIETQILHVSDKFLEQVGLDADSLKKSNSWTQYRVDDAGNPIMFVIDSQRKETLLKSVDESEGSSSISRIFMMGMSGREAMIKNYSGYNFKSRELGRFVKIKPQISQDGRGTYLDCEFLIRQVKYFGLFYDVYIDKKLDQNEISEAEIFEYQVNVKNARLHDDHALLILGGKMVSVRDVENRKPVLRHIPVSGEFIYTTSMIEGQANEIILIKTTIVPPEGNDDVNAKASSYNVAKIAGLDEANELVRIFLDLDDLEAGRYVEIKDSSKGESIPKQVDTSEIGRSNVEDFPAYAAYIDFEIRSNFDLNLSTERFTRGSFLKHDQWDAYFVSPDTITGDGYFSPTTLCVCMWKLEIWKYSPKDMADAEASLVAVKIKPKNKPQEKSDAEAGMSPDWAVEPIGRHVLSFDGVDDYLYVPASPTLELKPPFTIEMWIKPDFSECEKLKASGEKFIGLSLLLKGKNPQDVKKEQNGGFALIVQPPSKPENSYYGSFYLSTADGKLFQEDGFHWNKSETGQSEWIHIYVTCRRSEMYVPVPDRPLVIGEAIKSPIVLPPFKGEIAEIRIWNKKLTGEDIREYSYKLLTGSEPNLVACWDFERSGGQIVYDISPNKNHARLGNLPQADGADPEWIDLTATSNQPGQKTGAQAEVVGEKETRVSMSGGQVSVFKGASGPDVVVRKMLPPEGTEYYKKFNKEYLLEIVSKACEQDVIEPVDRKSSGQSSGPGYIQKRIGFGVPFDYEGVEGFRKLSEFQKLLNEAIKEDIKNTLGVDASGGWSSDSQHLMYSTDKFVGSIYIHLSQTGTNILQLNFVIQEVETSKDKDYVQLDVDTSGRLVDSSAFFTRPVTYIVNSITEQKDCFIDFDNNKLYSLPSDFYSISYEQKQAWISENGIDASASSSEGGEGLWGEQMVVIPVANEEYDRMTPVSFRKLLQQATPATPAVMTAIGGVPKTYIFKTSEGGMGLLQILEVQNEQSPRHIKIRYKMVPRTTEADDRITSDEKIQDFGKAMVRYMSDHQQTLPDNLRDFVPYLRNKQDMDWLSQNVTYLGKGRTMKDKPDTVIAYDHSLLDSDNGTNVLFLDAYVEFVKSERFKELDIIKEQIQIDERIPTVGEEFNKDIELDGNSLDELNIWSEKPSSHPTNGPAQSYSTQQNIISGRCLDFNGKPLSNAEVMIFCRDYNQDKQTELARDKTDSEGRFTLGPVKPIHEEDRRKKSYFVYVPPNGHGPAWKDIDSFNQNTDSLELKTHKPITISGSVVTEDSQPIAGAQVWVYMVFLPATTVGPKGIRIPNVFSTIAALPGWSATTDNDGVFNIDGVPDGTRISLLVTRRDYATSGIIIKPEMTEEINQVKMVPAAVIKGRVLNTKTGQPAAGVRVDAQAIDSIEVPGGAIMPGAQAVTDEKGRYELEALHANEYNIWATEKDLTVVALDSFEVEKGQIREAPDLLLIEGGFIVGRVINEQTGKPIRPGRNSDVAIHGPSRPKSGAAVEGSIIDEDGSFRIRAALGSNYIYLSPTDEWGRTEALVIPESQWVDVEDGQTVEVEFKIRKLSEQEKEKAAAIEAIRNSKRIPSKKIDELQEQKTQTEIPDRAEGPTEKIYGLTKSDYEAESRKARVLFEMQLLSLSERTLKEIETEIKPISIADGPVLDDRRMQKILQAVEAGKDSKIIGRVDVLTREGKRGRTDILNEKLSRGTTPGDELIQKGISTQYKFELADNKDDVLLDFELQICLPKNLKDLKSINDRRYSKSEIETFRSRVQKRIPDRHTFLFDGGDSTLGSRRNHKNRLLMIIKPSIHSQTKPAFVTHQIPYSIEQHDIPKVRLMQLGIALAIYADEHNEILPESLQETKSYFSNQEVHQWILEHVEYLGKGRSRQESRAGNIPVAYDRSLLQSQQGTNVLFLDAHVEFVKLEKLKKLDFIKKQIQIEAKILTVGEEFYKDFGLDGNSPAEFNIWPEMPSFMSQALPFDTNVVITTLNKQNLDFLLEAASAYENNKILTKPGVTVLENEETTFTFNRQLPFIYSFNGLNDSSQGPIPLFSVIQIGPVVTVTPNVRIKQQDILMKLKLEFCWIPRLNEYVYEDKYDYQTPLFSRRTSEFQFALSPGKTFFYNYGLKTLYEQEKALSELESPLDYKLRRERKAVIVLLTPTIVKEKPDDTGQGLEVAASRSKVWVPEPMFSM